MTLPFLSVISNNADLATQSRGNQIQLGAFFEQGYLTGIKERVENFLVGHSQGTQQNRDRQFPAAIDTGEDAVLGIKLKIKPGTAIRNNTRGKQQLATGMGFTFVVVEEYTG